MTDTPSSPPKATAPAGGENPRRRSKAALLFLAVIGFLLLATFVRLGVWQLERRAWKLALIEQVEAKVHGPAVAMPAPSQWPQVSANDAYQRVQVSGHFDHAREVLVQASTEFGAGFWVLTPLVLADGNALWVNRGFVDAAHRQPASRAEAPAAQQPGQVTGLLRLNEPGGGFLRRNDPTTGRWFSRDVVALSQAQKLRQAAPFFIDAEAADPASLPDEAHRSAGVVPSGQAWPIPGLTVVRFANNHMSYALTWFGMAALVLVAAWLVTRWVRRRSSDAD